MKIFSTEPGSLPDRLLRFISQLFKSIWLFFPGILFLFLPIFCFWMTGQGKDIMAAFVNIKGQPVNKDGSLFNSARFIFFVAIAFWVYVSWYSSRVIAYLKKNRQQLNMESINNIDRAASEAAYLAHDKFFEINKDFLDEIPRLIGNGCFLVLELAVLQSPLLVSPISSTMAWLFFFLAFIILHYINKWFINSQAVKKNFEIIFWTLLSVFIIIIVIVCFTGMNIWVLFGLILLLHVIFDYYINFRRVMMEKYEALKKTISTGTSRNILEKLMDYFCIPRKESGFFKWFLIICFSGIILYTMGIFWLGFSRWLGPFPFIILAFGVLLAFGNIVTAFSVRYKVNFHFLLLIIAFVFGLKETHGVRIFKLKEGQNGYYNKPDLKKYLNSWLDSRLDPSNESKYDMYFILSNGGASRSGYWTAAALGKIEDASLNDNLPGRFSDHIFCLSGTSGGGVGVATFFSLLRNKPDGLRPRYAASAQAYLKQDYFTFTFARMLGPDFFNYIFHTPLMEDRAGALEASFEKSAHDLPDSLSVPFNDDFSSFPAMNGNKTNMPILFINTTRMQDGNPGVITNLNLDSSIFNNRVDVVKLLDSNKDISITTAAILGARFPYISPAGRIMTNYFVDGGYFDNSGAGAVQEIIRAILNIAQQDASIRKKISRINFKVLHIINSPPPGFLSAGITRSVAPIKNDLMSPILTIMGAYDMQTTVNDRRLFHFLEDISSNYKNSAEYKLLSLYLTRKEWDDDKKREEKDRLYDHIGLEPAYAMNWFMSDTTLRRIDKRLISNPMLKYLTDSVKW